MSMAASDAGVLKQNRRPFRLAQLGSVLFLSLLKRWSVGKTKGFFEVCLGGTKRVGQKKKRTAHSPLGTT